MKNRRFMGKGQTGVLYFLLGVAAGVLTRLTDLLPRDSLWTLSSVATLFGFWIFSVTVIVCRSSSNKGAGVHTFLYLFGMTAVFYGLQYVLGVWMPQFDNGGFQTNLWIVYSVLSLLCGGGAYILYFWNRGNRVSAVLRALPVGALAAEAVGVAVYFAAHRVYLFQLLFDSACAVAFGVWFFRKSKNKLLYGAAVLAVTVAVYAAVYRPFLHV